MGEATTGRPGDYGVLLRYSPRCRTVWAVTGAQVQFWVERQNPYNYADAWPAVDGSVVLPSC